VKGEKKRERGKKKGRRRKRKKGREMEGGRKIA